MISVNPIWRPAQQLTTLDANGDGVTDSGDDIRYAAVDIYATSTVEFWAVGFTCTVNRLALESYTQLGDPNSTEDDVAMITIGASWPSPYTFLPSDSVDSNGKFYFAITIQGEYTRPMGSNGVSKTLHIATLKYRIKKGLVAATTSPFTCTTAFLNRDGKPVLTPTFVAPPALSVLPGYTLTGKVTYQGIIPAPTAAQAIEIECENDGDAFYDDLPGYPVPTTASITTGLFSVSGLRTQGRYDCRFLGNIKNPDSGNDLHLTAYTDFNLSTAKLALLPIVLKNGNTDTGTPGSETDVDISDLAKITINWINMPSAPYDLGDANGDKKHTEADLALVGANWQNANGLPPSNHVIYSLPRDQFGFQNSHLWLGTWHNTSPARFVTGNTQDYWPAVAPDGSRIAFVRSVGGMDKFALFVAPITNGVVGTAKQITSPSAYDAFAPSWSPDGARLAFVCAYSDTWLQTDPDTAYGNLCVIDPGGANFQQIALPIKIWPPGWLGTKYLYFTHMPGFMVCSDMICVYNLQTTGYGPASFVPAGSDLPVIHNGLWGPTLFYRYDDGGGNRSLRFAQLNAATGNPLAAHPSVWPSLHDTVPGTASLAYFAVSSGYDPHLFYYSNLPPDDSGGVTFRLYDFNGDFDTPAWTVDLVSTYRVADNAGNPAYYGGWYAALLNTVAFLPLWGGSEWQGQESYADGAPCPCRQTNAPTSQHEEGIIMQRSNLARLHLIIMLTVFAGLCLLAVPAQAQGAVPSITVNPVWRPAQQLTTLDANGNGQTDGGDDLRYVAVDIFATATVEFWAVGFTCTVNKLALESYVQGGDPGSSGDDLPLFEVGTDWTAPRAPQLKNTIDTDGALRFAISEVFRTTPPMGSNGVSETLHIATIRYRVRKGLVATTSTFICTTQFLNRDGKPVLTTFKFVAPPALSVLPGYTLSGKVTYQGNVPVPTAAQAIGIECDDSDGDALYNNPPGGVTANITTGLFSIGGLRTQGRYDCRYFGNIKTAGSGYDLHLQGITDFTLSTAKFALLPVVLRSGNSDTSTSGSEGDVDSADALLVTSNWLQAVGAPYDLGDVNGDQQSNPADLALQAGNYNDAEPILSHHLIYGLARDQFAAFNSHLWLGSARDATASRFITGNTRDYWPAVAPDGSRIAFIRNTGTGSNDKFALFVAPITNGAIGTAKQITPTTATYDAFAPAWSPDGARLAFVCSYNDEWFNADPDLAHGNLCLIDPGGTNIQRPELTIVGVKRAVPTRIEPPTWVNNSLLYFAYSAIAGAATPCDGKVCQFDLLTGLINYFAELPVGSDLPVAHNGLLGSTLFYRYDNGAGSRTLRYVTLNAAGNPAATYPDPTYPNLHNDVSATGSQVGYFAVSSGADPDIFFYTNDPDNGVSGGTSFYFMLFNGTQSAPTWAAPLLWTVNDAVSNAAVTGGYFAALLNTVAYLP